MISRVAPSLCLAGSLPHMVVRTMSDYADLLHQVKKIKIYV
jgi:hypothetical protein